MAIKLPWDGHGITLMKLGKACIDLCSSLALYIYKKGKSFLKTRCFIWLLVEFAAFFFPYAFYLSLV